MPPPPCGREDLLLANLAATAANPPSAVMEVAVATGEVLTYDNTNVCIFETKPGLQIRICLNFNFEPI